MEPNNQPLNPQQNNTFEPNPTNQLPVQPVSQPLSDGPSAPSVDQPNQQPMGMNPGPQFAPPTPSAQPQFSANSQPSGGGKKTGVIVGAIVGVVALLGLLGAGGYYAYTTLQKDNYNAKQTIQTALPNVTLTAPAPLQKLEAKDKESLGFTDSITGEFSNDNKLGIKIKDEGIYAQFEDPETKKKPVAAIYYVILDFSPFKALVTSTNELLQNSGNTDMIKSEADFLKEVRQEFQSSGQELADEIKKDSGSGNLTITETGTPVASGNGVELDIKAEVKETKQKLSGKLGVYIDDEWNMSAVVALAETEIWNESQQSFEEVFKPFRGGAAQESAYYLRKEDV